jgi:hypothetical protein
VTDEERLIAFSAWLRDRPEIIRDLGERFPPWKSYRIIEGAPYSVTASGSIVRIVAYVEDGLIRVTVVRPSQLAVTLTAGASEAPRARTVRPDRHRGRDRSEVARGGRDAVPHEEDLSKGTNCRAILRQLRKKE